MPSFSVEKYNQLLSIGEAHCVLRDQLDSAGKALRDLLTDPDITQLFAVGDYAYRFGICILHRHFTLREGERMVVRDSKDEENVSITEPQLQEGSENVYADRWFPDGTEFEHRVVTSGQPIDPPPPAFLDGFQRICARFNVDILGVCRADPYITTPADCVFLEEVYGSPDNRRQRTTFVPRATISPQIILKPSAWMPVLMDDTRPAFLCTCNCPFHVECPYPLPARPIMVDRLALKAENVSSKATSLVYRGNNANHI